MQRLDLLPILLLMLVPACSNPKVRDAERAEAAAAPTPIAIETAKVVRQELQRSVEAVGTLDPNEEVTIGN